MLSMETRQKAFALYCMGMKAPSIIKKLGIADEQTIYDWVKKHNWEEKRTDLQHYKDGSKDITDREQDLQIVESVLALYAKAVKENQGEMLKKLNYKDVMDAVKLRRLLKGESTENIIVNNEVMLVKEEVKKILEGNNE